MIFNAMIPSLSWLNAALRTKNEREYGLWAGSVYGLAEAATKRPADLD
jgi:hypothetical protein